MGWGSEMAQSCWVCQWLLNAISEMWPPKPPNLAALGQEGGLLCLGLEAFMEDMDLGRRK